MASLSSEQYAAFPNKLIRVITAVPSSPADLCSANAQIWQINICNTTAGALTFSIYDKQGTPRYALKAVSIAANTTYIVAWPEGQFFSDGVSWVASGSGLEASIVGGYET